MKKIVAILFLIASLQFAFSQYEERAYITLTFVDYGEDWSGPLNPGEEASQFGEINILFYAEFTENTLPPKEAEQFANFLMSLDSENIKSFRIDGALDAGKYFAGCAFKYPRNTDIDAWKFEMLHTFIVKGEYNILKLLREILDSLSASYPKQSFTCVVDPRSDDIDSFTPFMTKRISKITGEFDYEYSVRYFIFSSKKKSMLF